MITRAEVVSVLCNMGWLEQQFSPFDTYRCPSCRSRPAKPSKPHAVSGQRHHRRDSVQSDEMCGAHSSASSSDDTPMELVEPHRQQQQQRIAAASTLISGLLSHVN
eukprot:TRINITY_DN3800_c0_g1_i1.p2 TRINITY_DN3800_c0_g1~~TRINITY_DN3800_c0_g1_i1.p2  ORF type:complete len:106 (+),score=26.18 TRINITY_DN3800_c0_g1_i1:67-384(+)